MKIALLCHEYPPETGWGDVGSYAFQQARALARAGHEVHVFAGATARGSRLVWDGPVALTRAHRDGPLQRLGARLAAAGLTAAGERLRRGADTAGALRRALRSGSFDIVEVPLAGGEAPLLALCRELPVVVRVHNVGAEGTAALDGLVCRLASRAGLEAARAVSASSQWALDVLTRAQPLPRPAVVIRNGIEPLAPDEAPSGRAPGGADVPPGALLVVCLVSAARAREREVARALATGVPQAGVPAVLVLVTDEDGEALSDPGSALVVQARTQAERRAWIARADVVVHPREGASCPYACVEALSAGKPLVAADSGGVPELVVHRIHGLLAPAGEPAAFQAAVRGLLRDPARRDELGRRARERAATLHSDDAMAARSLDLYALAASLARAAVPVAREPTQLLGPDNWLDAWWLRRAPRATPGLALDAAGTPLLAALPLHELAFLGGIMSRAWADEHADWNAPEAELIRAVQRLGLDRALALRAGGTADEVGAAALALPGLDHPLLDGTRARWLAEEAWRLQGSPAFADWLVALVATPSFVERAYRNVQLRRLAVLAARSRPCAESYDALRALYRDKQTHDAVVRADRAFFESGGDAGAQLRAAIDAAGLHAPLRRPLAYGKAKRRPDGAPSPPPADSAVTVLIPSYEHARFVERAVRSALAQTLPPARVLVVDDHSSDRTVAAARRVVDSRVEVRTREQRLGLGGSVREALALIDTPFVALLNSDDEFHPDRLARCIDVLRGDPGAALVATGLDLIDAGGRRLTAETSCLVDVGPQAHGWVGWYARVVRELASGDDWVAPAALLRHNHLATSSNMVFRTPWLQQHIGEAAPLRYCVDWMLFLLAAIEGTLRYLPEPLLGYRFHGDNTVWFRKGGHAGYVLEVNRVVARALRAFVASRARTIGPERARGELAALLADHVSRHGETEGLALVLEDLAGELRPGDVAADDADLERFVREALDRKTLQSALRHVDVPPWRMADLAWRAGRSELDAFLAEGMLRRVEAQTGELQALRWRVEDGARRLADLRAVVEKSRADVRARDAERERAVQELEQLRERLAALRRERDQLALRAEQVTEQALRLREERDVVRANADALEAAEAAVRARARALQSELEAAARQLRALERERDDAVRRAQQLRDQLDTTEHTLGLMRQLAHERAAALRELPQSPEWRAGQLLLHRLRLRRPFEMLLGGSAALRVRASRARARLRRALDPAPRIVVACDGPFPALDSGRLAGEMHALLEAGFDVRLVSFGRGPARHLGAGGMALVQRRHVLHPTPGLARGDRAWCEKRAPAALEALAAELTPPALARVCSLARSAAAIGAGYVHAVGPEAAALARGAAKLLGIPFGVAFSGSDLAETGPASAHAQALREAALVAADCAATARALAEAAGGERELLVRPPPVYSEPAPPAVWNGALRAAVAPAVVWPELRPLADAVQRAVASGADVRIELLDRPRRDGRQPADLLRAHVRQTPVADRFAFVAAGRAELDAALARAQVLIATSWLDGGRDSAGVPVEALAAMAAGIPVIAAAGSALAGLVRDRVDGLVVDLRDPASLARALQELGDAALRASLGRQARERFLVDYAPAVSSAALHERIRALLGAPAG